MKLSRRGKWAIIVLYFLIFATAVTINIDKLSDLGAYSSSNNFLIRIVFAIVFPFGIFVVFSAVQALVYHFGKRNGKLYFNFLFALPLFKAFACFLIELFMLDHLNIIASFTRLSTYYRGILLVSFLALILAAAATEIIVLIKLKKSTNICTKD